MALHSNLGGIMEKKNHIVEKLCDLIQLDIDAVRAYEQALKNIDVMTISDQIETFRADHERHIEELSQIVRDFGAEPPEVKPDFKGFFIEGFTAIRSMTGTEGALKAMRGNEQLTNMVYRRATTLELPSEVLNVVQRNYGDEMRHLSAIEKMLNERTWDKSEARV
jgi:rubrerythrin